MAEHTLRRAQCELMATEETKRLERMTTERTALDALRTELDAVLSAVEKNRLVVQRADLDKRIAEQEKKIAVFQTGAAQCDDEECCACLEVLIRCGVINPDNTVEITDARKRLVSEVEALQVSDAAKKLLINLRWQ